MTIELHYIMVVLFSPCRCFLLWPRPSLSWSYGSWIYNYICNQYLSPLKLWVRIPLMMRC